MSLGMLYRRARDLLFPRKCVACNTLLDWYETPRGHEVLCEDCLTKWNRAQEECCNICGKRVTACTCVTEVMDKAKCQLLHKLVYYQPRTADAVQNRLLFYMKRTRDAEVPFFLAGRLLPMLRRLQEEKGVVSDAICITYLPRGRRAKLEHGTDQGECLARALAKLSGIPCRALILRDRRQSMEQKTLSPTARLQNARRAFQIAPGVSLRGKTVILVDDIVTTGSGMAIATRLLRRAGALEVWCFAVASDDVNRERK